MLACLMIGAVHVFYHRVTTSSCHFCILNLNPTFSLYTLTMTKQSLNAMHCVAMWRLCHLIASGDPFLFYVVERSKELG